MSANVVARTPTWRVLLWAGVVGSILTWAWAWYVVGGFAWLGLVVAIASVVFAYGSTSGMRVAMAGLMVIGLTLFLASLYWMATLFLNPAGVTAMNVITTGVFPFVAAVLLLAGAGVGYRHTSAS